MDNELIYKLDVFDLAKALKTSIEMTVELTECCGGYHGVKCPASHICTDMGEDWEATNRDECLTNMLKAVLQEALTPATLKEVYKGAA